VKGKKDRPDRPDRPRQKNTFDFEIARGRAITLMQIDFDEILTT
jgi:hypothetical protein